MKRDPRSHLEDASKAAAVIADYVGDTDREGYLTDLVMQWVVERQYTVFIENMNRLAQQSPAAAAQIPDLQESIDQRNHLIHGYESFDPEDMWKAVREELPRQLRAIQSILAELVREAAATQDPRLADDVLVLSCAVTERVDAFGVVSRASMSLDIEDVLRKSALATNVREAKVDETAAGIVHKRAETDLRVAAARAIGGGEIFEVRARFDGNPDYPAQKDIDAYEATIAEGMQRLARETPVSTEIEHRVARAVVAMPGMMDRYGHSLKVAMAMANALERGTPSTATEIRKEQTALLAELQELPKTMESYRERALLRRIYRSFTAAEVRALSLGRGPILENLSDDTARAQVTQSVQWLHRKSWLTEPSPWRLQHRALARQFGAEHVHGHAHGRYLGAEMDI